MVNACAWQKSGAGSPGGASNSDISGVAGSPHNERIHSSTAERRDYDDYGYG